MAEQILGGAETREPLTLLPLHSRGGLDGLDLTEIFTADVITREAQG